MRSLLLGITSVSLCLGLWVYPVVQKQRTASKLLKMGADLTYDYQWGPNHEYRPNATAPGSPVLKRILGDKYKANIVEVQLFAGPGKSPEQFGDSDAADVATLTELEWLVLQNTSLTDAGLKQFSRLRKLQRLDLDGSAVTSRGVEELRGHLPKVDVYFDAQ